MRKLHQLSLALLAAVAAGGCGNGDAGDAATAKTVTEADVAKAPPEAQKHVSEMNDYSKAMNAGMANKAGNR